MALRNGHSNGKSSPRLEVLPPDELPRGVPAPKRLPAPKVKRTAAGRVLTSEAARELARRGGQAKAGRTALAHKLHMDLRAATFAPYVRAAESFARTGAVLTARDARHNLALHDTEDAPHQGV